MEDINQEVVEWGIKRDPIYIRQRKAFNEMEEKNYEKQQCSNSHTTERNN